MRGRTGPVAILARRVPSDVNFRVTCTLGPSPGFPGDSLQYVGYVHHLLITPRHQDRGIVALISLAACDIRRDLATQNESKLITTCYCGDRVKAWYGPALLVDRPTHLLQYLRIRSWPTEDILFFIS